MRKDEVSKAITEKLRELGVPEHVYSVQLIPSMVRLRVLAGSSVEEVLARSGITRLELNEKLKSLEEWWVNHNGQVDIEEAIKKEKAA